MDDYGEECRNCECLTCVNNDDVLCKNCSRCNGNIGYSKWMMNCKKYKECSYPEENIKTILG